MTCDVSGRKKRDRPESQAGFYPNSGNAWQFEFSRKSVFVPIFRVFFNLSNSS